VERSANEADEQRMTATRVRREFRMELAAEEPRMLRQLDHFAQVAGDVALRPCADGEARGLQPRQIMIVDFVAVPVTFGDAGRAVDAVRKRSWNDLARLRAQAHRTAQLGFRVC